MPKELRGIKPIEVASLLASLDEAGAERATPPRDTGSVVTPLVAVASAAVSVPAPEASGTFPVAEASTKRIDAESLACVLALEARTSEATPARASKPRLSLVLEPDEVAPAPAPVGLLPDVATVVGERIERALTSRKPVWVLLLAVLLAGSWAYAIGLQQGASAAGHVQPR